MFAVFPLFLIVLPYPLVYRAFDGIDRIRIFGKRHELRFLFVRFFDGLLPTRNFKIFFCRRFPLRFGAFIFVVHRSNRKHAGDGGEFVGVVPEKLSERDRGFFAGRRKSGRKRRRAFGTIRTV